MSKWMEIFRTGTFAAMDGRRLSYGAADLDRIVNTYQPNMHEAPLVIGHPEHNHPAWGWVAALKRVDDRLLMLPKQVVPAFAEMVRNGMFKKRSISLYPDGSLRHVGFLGALPPAVKGLEDVAFGSGCPWLVSFELDGICIDFADNHVEAIPWDLTKYV
jgi:hypothetical protein